MRLALAFLCFSFAFSSYADDIFVTPEGRGAMTGADWSNALNGSLDGFHIDVKSAITAAVEDGATEVNVYYAGGTYAVTNQLALDSITIPVKLSGGYLAETDGSLEKGDTATTFTRTANNVRHISASSLTDFTVEGITFSKGYISAKGGKGGSIYLASSSTVVSNCVFSANRVHDSNSGGSSTVSFGGGGAVAAVSGELSLIDCRFTGNYREGGAVNATWGGAVYANTADLSVADCTFTGNYLDCESARPYLFGAAVGTYKGDVSITNCVFANNYIRGCSTSGGAWAGAMAIRNATQFRMSDCVVTNCYVANTLTTQWQGGLMLLDDLYAADGIMTSVVERCVFDLSGVPNTIKPNSGSNQMPVRSDIVLLGGHLCMTNCVIAGTRGSNSGMVAAIRVSTGTVAKKGFGGYSYATSGSWTAAKSSAELVNCTIADGNKSGVCRQVNSSYVTELTLKNCISYGHSVSGVVDATSIEYSCIQEEHEGEGNFVPESVEALNWTGAPYYHLLTKKANGAITNGWFSGTFESKRTAADSPCIDAGAAGFPVGLEPEPNGRRVNLGAYGGTQWASLTSGAIGLIVTVQ